MFTVQTVRNGSVTDEAKFTTKALAVKFAEVLTKVYLGLDVGVRVICDTLHVVEWPT